MAFVYCAAVKFPSTVLCENTKEGNESLAKVARSRTRDVYKEEQEIKLSEDYTMYSLKLALDNEALFVCVAKQSEVYREKAFTVLQRIRRGFLEEFFHGQFPKDMKLQPMCYQQDFAEELGKIADTFDTGIKRGRVLQAQTKIDETAAIMQKALHKQVAHAGDTLLLVDKTEEMKGLGAAFLVNTRKFEAQIKKESFWWCSRNCLLLFCIPTLFLFFYVCYSFVYCGDLTAAVGCRNPRM